VDDTVQPIGGSYLADFDAILNIELGNFSKKMNPEMASKQLRLIEDLATYGKSRPLHELL